MDDSSIKENIRRFRLERKMTQIEMANLLGLSTNAYGEIERGSTSIMNGNVLRLAELLNTSTEEIVLGYRPVQMPGKKLEEMKAEYSARIESLEKENEYLRKLVKSLEETIATKTQIIEMLQK